VVNEETITGKFCVSDGQREGEYVGTYRDYDYTLWKWQCKEPEAPPEPEVKEKPIEYVKVLELPPWSTLEDTGMEWVLWITYLSSIAWVFGWVVTLPLGIGVIIWLQILSIWNFFELLGGMGDFGLWFMGPFWRGWISQPFIFNMNIIFSAIPLMNFFMPFLLGWWAIADYYGFNYELFAGP